MSSEKEAIIRILMQHTMPMDQLGFVSVEDVANMILDALGKPR